MSPCQVPVANVSVPPTSGGSGAPGVDVGQAGFYIPTLGPFAFQASNFLVANRGYFCRFACPKTLTVSKLSFVVNAAATADDPCDVGIFNQAGTVLLGSSGSASGRLNSTGVKQVNLQAPVSLVAGQVYYAAFAYGPVGGTAAQIITTNAMLNSFTGMFGPGQGTAEGEFASNAFPLVAPIVPGGPYATIPIMALMV